MLLEQLSISARDFESGTGWRLAPEGACRGEVCIPLRDAPVAPPVVTGGDAGDRRDRGDGDALVANGGGHDLGDGGGLVDVESIAEQMGLPLVHDAEHDVWALGPWPGAGRALVSAEAPDLSLPDLDGNMFHLSSLRGQKVVVLAWAPY